MTPAQKRRRQKMREAAELRAKGWSLRVIARHLEVNPETIRQWLKRRETSIENPTPGVGKSTPKIRQWAAWVGRGDLPEERGA